MSTDPALPAGSRRRQAGCRAFTAKQQPVFQGN